MAARTPALRVAILLCVLPAAGSARQVDVPLRLDHGFVQRILIETIYTGPEQSAEVWNDGRGCNQMLISEPAVSSREGRLVVRTRARVKLGAWVGRCMPLPGWDGIIEVLEEPRVDPGSPVVHFKVVDSNVEGIRGGKGLSGNLWGLVKTWVHPRLEELAVDLRAPLDELKRVLPLFLQQEDLTRTRVLLDSLGFADPEVTDDGLALKLRLDLSELQPQAPTVQPGPEPTLTAEELARWDAAWQRWDAYLTFAVKRLARGRRGEEQLRQLRDTLLAARYELAEALANTSEGGSDPVRKLFLRTASRLGPVLRELSVGLPGEEALRYLSLIAATDALRAIDDVGYGFGIDISADGLRRLARIVDPSSADDPLRYDTDVDPELRELFGLGTPLPEPTPPATSLWLDRFVGRAWAAEEAADLSQKLNGWAPNRADAARYLPLVLRLLDLTSEKTLANRTLAKELRPLFRSLLLAAAWQESCWRQCVQVGGRVRPLVSAAGSIGLMQINQHVWRGLYDVRSLREDIAYNALAGSEILAHYLIDYAIKKGEHTATGNVDNLARATYAVYNGGPGHLRRYRGPARTPHLRAIDEAFWKKYREVRKGNELAVRACYG